MVGLVRLQVRGVDVGPLWDGNGMMFGCGGCVLLFGRVVKTSQLDPKV